MEKCLEHAQSQRPNLILTGGDLIMDALGTDLSRAKSQWDSFQHVLRANIASPVRHCIGNHDIWGWTNPAYSSSQPAYGKALAMDRLELERPYYSFTEAGWHFIVLDSTEKKRGLGYKARLDDAQFEWLAGDLARTPAHRPVCVLTHIPIVSACVFFDGPNERAGYWTVPSAFMHTDARRIKDLFRQHANVKLCLSGHIHLVDTVRYLGVTYVCNGAASGGWWKGPYQETRNGYGLVDFYSDGSFRNRYVEYDWKA
jgi:3',5'-cyclic AMP phosphodiesterase CpdA